MIFEYLMMIGHAELPILKKYSSWKDNFTVLLCDSESLNCKNEWQQWFSISGMPENFLILDFIYLLSTLLTRATLSN